MAEVGLLRQNVAMPDAERTWNDLGFSEDTLQENLAALQTLRPHLADFLRDSGIHDQLTVVERDGEALVHRLFRRQLVPVQESRRELQTPWPEETFLDEGALALSGVGCGERLYAMLSSVEGDRKLIVFDSDPSLLYLTLSRYPLAPWIQSGQLEFCLGAELRATALPPIGRLCCHPAMDPMLYWDRVHLRGRLKSQHDVAGSARPEEGMSVAVLQGELLTSECASFFHSIGHDVFLIDHRAWTADQIAHQLALFCPAFIFSINFFPTLGGIAGRLGIPFLAWEIDPCASTIPPLDPMDRAAGSSFVFTWRKGRTRLLQQAGYQYVHHLPLAASTGLRRPGLPLPEGQNAAALSFVGSCMRRMGREHQDLLRQLAAARPQAEDWRAFFAGLERLKETIRAQPCRRDLEERLADLAAACSIPLCLDLEGEQADLIVLAGETLASEKRVAVVRSLVDLGIVVHGEKDWQQAIPEVDYRGPLGHGDALSAHFGHCAINIDINRIYQPDIVTLRTFEVAACGGFLLTEENEDVAELFKPDEEIVFYRNVDDLRDKVTWFLEHSSEREQIARAFHERFMRDHRLEQRLDRLLKTWRRVR